MQERFVRMTTDERSEHAKTIASHRNRQITLEDEKDEKARHYNTLIKAEQAEIDRVVRLITDDGESRNQMDLFVDANVATSALAEVAKRADDTGAAGPDGRLEPEDAIKAQAQEFVDSLKGLLPESLNHVNTLLKEWWADRPTPERGVKGRVRKAVDELLADAERAGSPAKAGKAPKEARAHA